MPDVTIAASSVKAATVTGRSTRRAGGVDEIDRGAGRRD